MVFSIAYFINFACCLIFNEVFILNFCGLDYNTNKRIIERTKKEAMEAENDKNMLEMENEIDDREDQSSNWALNLFVFLLFQSLKYIYSREVIV